MTKTWIIALSIYISFFCITGCAEKLVDVNVTIIDQKTALENQILGSYEELGNEVLLLASVRSVDDEGKLKPVIEVPKGKRMALKAIQRQEFNRDDILEFKSTLCVGEGNDGLLKYFENERTLKDSDYKKFVMVILKEENKDRLTILKRIVATNENFSDKDLPKVQKISASLNRDNAHIGEKIQSNDGTWSLK
jgi:hypothetical protein